MSSFRWSRRSVLSALPTMFACATTKSEDDLICVENEGLSLLSDGSALDVPVFASNPFTLGVASGGILSDRVILWTRIAPDPFSTAFVGGVEVDSIPVKWEIAKDEYFSTIVGSGVVATRTDLAHAVHIDAGDLEPDSWYWYRFSVGDWVSPVGKTRTAPCAAASVASLRFATTSCHRYEHGFFTGLADLAEQTPDVVFQLGDYIYEYGEVEDVRAVPEPICMDLEGYRLRYARYKTDEHLQNAHACCPWEVIWDDHEVKNNYFGTTLDPIEQEKIRAGYQAYYEHMPLRLLPPNEQDMKLYRTLDWGDLARFYLLDTRQYRSEQSCRDECVDRFDPARTMLGTEQEEWLNTQLSQSTARWNVLAQQIVMANFNISEALLNYDQWDGYPAARERLLNHIYQQQIPNLLVFTGDIHISGLAKLHADIEDFGTEIIGYEFVTPSLTSNARELEDSGAIIEYGLRNQENISYVYAQKRGYLLIDMNKNEVHVSYKVVESVYEENQPVYTRAKFAVLAEGFQLIEEANEQLD